MKEREGDRERLREKIKNNDIKSCCGHFTLSHWPQAVFESRVQPVRAIWLLLGVFVRRRVQLWRLLAVWLCRLGDGGGTYQTHCCLSTKFCFNSASAQWRVVARWAAEGVDQRTLGVFLFSLSVCLVFSVSTCAPQEYTCRLVYWSGFYFCQFW